MKNFPITKWGGTNIKEHYQSNHNLQKFKELKEQIKKLENYLNSTIKKDLLRLNSIGNSKLKVCGLQFKKKMKDTHYTIIQNLF